MIGDLFLLSVRNVLHRKLRSWLTVIGILIGTAAVVALISIGQGLQRSITHEVERIMGFNTLLITPAAQGFQARIQLDLAALRSVPGVEEAVAVRTETAYVAGPAREGFLSLTGYDPAMEEFVAELKLELESGEGFSQRGQVVLGARAAQLLGARVGDTVRVEERPFQVVGILAPQEEGGTAYGGISFNDSLFVFYDDLKELFPGPDLAQYGFVKVASGADVGAVKAGVERALARAGINEAEVIGFEEITQRIRAVLSGVQAFLAAIAGISILVGGVGVMNTMYTAVLERTREIGVMKAVGAKNSHVLLLFLLESGLMGLVGGGLGLGVGLGVAQIAAVVVRRLFEAGFSVAVSAGLVVGALLFSFGVGAISGLLPARRAALLPPVEALRYE
ncbi:MAG: hypothetical protein XD60_0180 [Acetothermia bacterium 64_32]|nr:MAG: hypothetical protein XD60_0180 [Acetothermia bacterium 64_32]HAF69758.1 hypothetical protein [Candidatus Acetothermia bacterium]